MRRDGLEGRNNVNQVTCLLLWGFTLCPKLSEGIVTRLESFVGLGSQL